jgi:hypothetical protein
MASLPEYSGVSEPRPWTPAEDARLADLRLAECGDYRRVGACMRRTAADCRARWLHLTAQAAAARRASRRPCLTCGEPFTPEPRCFVCDTCKATQAWRYGAIFA